MTAVAGGSGGVRPSAPPVRPRLGADTITGWLFSAPALVLIVAFILVPFVLAFYFSFTNERLLAPPGRQTQWVGLDNYVRVFENPRFWTALTNNIVFSLVVVPLQTFFALFLAILVNQKLRGVVVFRTIFFMPITVVMAATAVIWIVLLNPEGLVNAFFEIITLGNFSPDWLGDPAYALAGIIMVSIWASVGFQMVILLAALQDVPESLYEAARLDGANNWQQFLHVTLPGIRNPLLFVLTITTILAFRLFDQVWIMPDRPGGPLDATRTLMVDIVDTGLEPAGGRPRLCALDHLPVDRARRDHRPETRRQAGRGDPVSAAANASSAGQGTTLEQANAAIRRQHLRRYIVSYGVLILLALFFLFPIAFMVVGAFKADTSVVADSGSLRAFVPVPFVGLENFQQAAERGNFWISFRNSAIISAGIVAGGLVVNSLLGYALARVPFRGKGLLLLLVVALIIVPFETLAVPLLLIMAELGWTDTLHAQIFPFLAQPLYIFLFYSFFLGIPRELEEAARIDGAGAATVFFRIAAPLAKPAYAAAGILIFLASWGQYLWPVMVTRSIEARPLPMGIAEFQGLPPRDWGDIMAYAALMVIPLLVVFIIFQRQFVRGVATTGLKG